MLFLKRGLMAAGALALAAMLLNFVAPRAAHALVATAVQVMNTSDAPVMTRDVDRAGSKALVLQCTAAASDTCTTPPPSRRIHLRSRLAVDLRGGCDPHHLRPFTL
jgi:hypothetical protein